MVGRRSSCVQWLWGSCTAGGLSHCFWGASGLFQSDSRPESLPWTKSSTASARTTRNARPRRGRLRAEVHQRLLRLAACTVDPKWIRKFLPKREWMVCLLSSTNGCKRKWQRLRNMHIAYLWLDRGWPVSTSRSSAGLPRTLAEEKEVRSGRSARPSETILSPPSSLWIPTENASFIPFLLGVNFA